MKSETLLNPADSGVIHLDEVADAPEAGIISRALLDQDGARVIVFAFGAGQRMNEHSTPARALVQILSGSAEFTLAGKPVTLNTGDLLHMPPGLSHGVSAKEDFKMLLITLKPTESPVK